MNGQRPRLLPALLAAMAVSIAACSAGSGDGLNISGRPLSEGGDVPLAATLESIQANLFDPSCIVCHSGANAPQGLRLDSVNSYTNLVGVRSVEDGSFFRVSPSDPGNSYLIHKLEGTASVGERMPFGGAAIPQATIDFVRQWITDGAQPVVAVSPGFAPVVISLTFMPGAADGESSAQIVAAFDQDIDASTIHGITFVLVGSGGDGRFDDGNETVIAPASVTLSNTNARLAIMDLTGVMISEDRYQVTLRGSGASMILSVAGEALIGGDFLAEFELPGISQ